MLAAAPYPTQLLTFWFAIGPVVILVALIIGTTIWQRRRAHRRRSRGT